MRPLTTQANGLVFKLNRATTALNQHLQTSTAATLGELEKRLDELLKEYRLLLSEIYPNNVWAVAVTNKSDYNMFFRCMVAFSSIVTLVAEQAGTSLGIVWGRHLFNARDFAIIGFDDLPAPLPDQAVKRILADQASDLLGAFVELVALVPARPHAQVAIVERQLKEICRACNCPSSVNHNMGFDLWDASRFAAELSISVADALRMARSREVLSVPSWTGEVMFPTYQTVMGALKPQITHVCINAMDSFRDWPLAIWMARNIDQDLSYFEPVLSGRGLWKPALNAPATGQFAGIANPAPTRVPKQVFRIARHGFGPFFFASIRTSASGALLPPAGRFDLPQHSALGSMYTAETALGACFEVLDREPVITLHEIVGRMMWELGPLEQLDVADLSRYSTVLAACTIRNDTQEVAETLAASAWRGLKAGLRTNQTEIGFILFGPAGSALPASASLGIWSAQPEQLLQTDALWEYLQDREDMHEDFPIVLRRFPPDISYN